MQDARFNERRQTAKRFGLLIELIRKREKKNDHAGKPASNGNSVRYFSLSLSLPPSLSLSLSLSLSSALMSAPSISRFGAVMPRIYVEMYARLEPFCLVLKISTQRSNDFFQESRNNSEGTGKMDE